MSYIFPCTCTPQGGQVYLLSPGWLNSKDACTVNSQGGQVSLLSPGWLNSKGTVNSLLTDTLNSRLTPRAYRPAGQGMQLRDPSEFKPCLYLVRTTNRTQSAYMAPHHTSLYCSGPGQRP